MIHKIVLCILSLMLISAPSNMAADENNRQIVTSDVGKAITNSISYSEAGIEDAMSEVITQHHTIVNIEKDVEPAVNSVCYPSAEIAENRSVVIPEVDLEQYPFYEDSELAIFAVQRAVKVCRESELWIRCSWIITENNACQAKQYADDIIASAYINDDVENWDSDVSMHPDGDRKQLLIGYHFTYPNSSVQPSGSADSSDDESVATMETLDTEPIKDNSCVDADCSINTEVVESEAEGGDEHGMA